MRQNGLNGCTHTSLTFMRIGCAMLEEAQRYWDE